VQKGDLLAAGPGARLLVDEPQASFTAAIPHDGDVLGRHSDVMQARALALDEAGDGALVGSGGQQFHVTQCLGAIKLEKSHLHIFLGDFLDSFQLQTQ